MEALREHLKEDTPLADAIQRSQQIDEVVADTIAEQRNKHSEHEVSNDTTQVTDTSWDITAQNEFVEYERPSSLSDTYFTPKFAYTAEQYNNAKAFVADKLINFENERMEQLQQFEYERAARQQASGMGGPALSADLLASVAKLNTEQRLAYDIAYRHLIEHKQLLMIVTGIYISLLKAHYN